MKEPTLTCKGLLHKLFYTPYVNGLSAKGRFTKDIEKEVKKVKEHKETRWEYMTLMMEISSLQLQAASPK